MGVDYAITITSPTGASIQYSWIPRRLNRYGERTYTKEQLKQKVIGAYIKKANAILLGIDNFEANQRFEYFNLIAPYYTDMGNDDILSFTPN
jgi:hypothetical protein